MTASLIPVPKSRFFDASGNPLAGGKVYTYEAGGTTPKATYTDYTATTPNTNPVILDAAGEANIWYDGNYKVVLKDSADVQQWSVDNISTLSSQISYAGGLVTGTADALIVANVSPSNFTLTNNVSVTIIPVLDNTGAAATIDIASSGIKSIKLATVGGLVDPYAGTLKANIPALLTWNGTYWVVTASITNLPPFFDTTTLVKGSTDATKQIRFEVDGLTTATTRVITVPDADITLVGQAYQQTLTNKKLTDSSTQIIDNTDSTKQAEFQCSGIATGTLRTFAFPNASGTLALTSDIFIKGWAKFTGVSLIAGSGITSIANGSTGNYTVTIAAQANANYAVQITCDAASTYAAISPHFSTASAFSAPTTTSFIFSVADVGGTPRNYTHASIIIAGN